MLELIYGRSIYTPLFSAIFWELHSPVLEDILQIEVVSGPGGTLYGPNAVNGVINITTKSARDTLGGLARGTIAANDRTAARSEEHTSELQSQMRSSYAVFCLKKKTTK